MRLHTRFAVIAAVAVLAAAAAGCGGDSTDEPDPADKAPVIIEITEAGGEITPNDGHVVKVDAGQEVQLNVSSDTDDEIHVHSEPEHEFEIPAGQDKTFTFTIDTPGTVAIESHGLETTIVKLQVS